jgi:hypothetical protein
MPDIDSLAFDIRYALSEDRPSIDDDCRLSSLVGLRGRQICDD